MFDEMTQQLAAIKALTDKAAASQAAYESAKALADADTAAVQAAAQKLRDALNTNFGLK